MNTILNVTVLRDARGEPLHCIAQILDISDRLRAETEIRQTRNFLQTIIDHLPVSVFVKDGKKDQFGTFKLLNRTCELMLLINFKGKCWAKPTTTFSPKNRQTFSVKKTCKPLHGALLRIFPQNRSTFTVWAAGFSTLSRCPSRIATVNPNIYSVFPKISLIACGLRSNYATMLFTTPSPTCYPLLCL